VAGYSIQVSANTSKARDALKKLGKDLDVATKARKLVIDKTGLKDYQTAFKKAGAAAANAGKTIANSQEAIQKNIAATSKALNPRTFLTNAFQKAAASGMKLVDVTAKLTVAIYGINAAVGALTRSFSGLFQQTIGRAAKLEATLLKTKTTLASTTDVFVNGNKITDPLEAINALSGQIDERVASIRKRTLELAGVTSGQVVEVFGIVASQAGQIGANLKEAEDLAINFAGALGTFGIPLYQARQEITSILQGNINQDSYLAKALGITNEDIQKARTEIGGITKFLDDRLSAAVAGQAIAAKQLEGVVSNIVEVWEEFGLAIGQVALQPLIDGLTFVFETLIDSLDVIKKIGAQVGKIGAGIGSSLAGAAGFNALDGQGTGAAAQRQAEQLFKTIEGAFGSLNTKLAEIFDSINQALSRVLSELGKAIAMLTDAFAQLAGAVLDLGLEQIKAVIGALAQVAPILTSLVKIAADLLEGWADFLKLPLVKYLTGVAATFKILQLTGVNAVVAIVAKLIVFNVIIRRTIKTATTVFIKVKQGVAIVIRAIGKVLIAISRVIQKLTKLGTTSGLVTKKAAADMKKLAAATRTAGTAAKSSAVGFNLMGVGIKKAAVAMKGLIASTVGLLLLQVAISAIVFAITKLNEQASKTAEQQKLNSAIATLDRTAQGAADGGLSDLDQRLRDIASAEVNKEIDKIAQAIYELDEELEKLEARRDAPKRNTRGGGNTRSRAIKDIEENRAERAKLEKEIADLRKKLGIDAEEDVVETRKKQEVKLSKEIAAFNRQQADALFAKRQELARKEVEIFKAAGDLRIKQMEMANKKMIEGQEGVSRTALEALNKYLVDKKRGELDIQVAEQNLEIAMQDRAKALEQYRVRIQEQINKMRQKIGQYEKEVADYRLQQAKKEGDARTESGAKQGGGTVEGGSVVGSGAYPVTSGRGFRIHPIHGDRRMHHGIDYGAPMGAPLSTTMGGKVTGVGNDPGGYGKWVEIELENGMKAFWGHLSEVVLQTGQSFTANQVIGRIGSTGGSTGPHLHSGRRGIGNEADAYTNIGGKVIAKPTEPVQMAVEDTSSAGIEAANAGLNDADQRLKSIRESMNALTNESNLDAVAEAFGPKGGIEQLEDQVKTAQAGLSAGGATEAQRIEIEFETRRQRMLTERAQVQAELDKNEQMSAEKKQELMTKIDEQQSKALDQLQEEKELRLELLSINQQAEALQDVRDRTESLEEQNQLLQLRNRLEMEGVEGPVIEGEIAKAKNQQLLNRLRKDGVKITDELLDAIKALNTEIDKGVKAQLAAQDPLNRLFKQWQKDISDTRQMIANMAQTITSELGRAMSDAITGLIDGTKTAQEAFANMFKNIGEAFIRMATEMIAKALTMKALGLLFPGSDVGGVGVGIGQSAAFKAGWPGNMNYSGGGYTGDGPRSGGIDGEGGFAAILHPQEYVFDAYKDSRAAINNDKGYTQKLDNEDGAIADSRNYVTNNSYSSSQAFSESQAALATSTSSTERIFDKQMLERQFSNPSPIKLDVETTVINGIEYLTVAQGEAMAAAAVQQAKGSVFSDLKNRPAARRQVGMR